MLKCIALLLILLAAARATSHEKPETWWQVGSQHFTVVTNANEKTARRIADQFERMRSVFHVAFPGLSIDNDSPIVVLAIKDEKTFSFLEPQSYLAKGQLRLAGVFLHGPEKNFVLMRVDAQGEHPYSVIYHEYTHFLLSRSAEWLPLWLNEGLAEFYQNTDIYEKTVALGQPSRENLQILREKNLLPLPALFSVDSSSPYYHEENKGSIFYAESWALTHYLYVKDQQENTQRLSDYGALLAKKVDSVAAARRAFGNLEQLQSHLEAYIRQGSYSFFKLAASTRIDDSAFKSNLLTATEADAVQVNFLVDNERFQDARPLLDHVLQQDPANVSAQESMGLLEFRAGHLDAAREWYERAVKLDSHSYLAHYYFAAIAMDHNQTQSDRPSDDVAVENSLRAAIKLNPSFAPAFERLAAFQGMRRQNLDEAHRMALTASQLDPANISYRMTTASVLVQMERTEDAVAILQAAMHIAKSAEETAKVQRFLTQIESYATDRDQPALTEEITTGVQADTALAVENDVNAAEAALPAGPHRFVVGMLQNVHCHTSGIDFTVANKDKTLSLHSGNYFKIEFSVLGFALKGALDPCKDLEGKSAKVEFVESAARPTAASIVAIELHKK